MPGTDPTQRRPVGDVYDWYVRGLKLLDAGHPAAAAELLAHAAAADPGSASIREALGRARLGAKQFERAREDFAWLADTHPDDDYAHFALGLALSRLGDPRAAAEQLALACAMRPDRDDYARLLAQVRATGRAQSS
ncbi:MAG: tetratricopeptide repeat protein [Actinomycetes bacterium]